MGLRNSLLRAFFAPRLRAIDRFRQHPAETQERMLRRLLEHGADTAFGREFDLRSVRSVEQFQARVGTFDYDSFKPYIERMKAGERDVTARGRVHLFARSSGTTSDRSKYKIGRAHV